MVIGFRRTTSSAALVVAVQATAITLAHQSPAPDYHPAPFKLEAVPVTEAAPIRVDGELTEEVWTTGSAMSAFRQREPVEGGSPSHPTEVRVAYDAVALYVAVVAHDSSPDRIVAHLNRRDESSPSDWIHVLVDSYHDRRTAFEFSVNPAGVKIDKYWFDDVKEDASWDAIWDVRTSGRCGRLARGISDSVFPAPLQPGGRARFRVRRRA